MIAPVATHWLLQLLVLAVSAVILAVSLYLGRSRKP